MDPQEKIIRPAGRQKGRKPAMDTNKNCELLAYYNAQRDPLTHKGDYGRVFIAAGSEGMTGAALLCAESALRAGAGLVYLSHRADFCRFMKWRAGKP